MLILKVFVNDKQIDEIHIQNIGKFDDIYIDSPKKRKDLCMYKIVKPIGFEHDVLLHTRSKGHRVLISKVMELIKHSRRTQ